MLGGMLSRKMDEEQEGVTMKNGKQETPCLSTLRATTKGERGT